MSFSAKFGREDIFSTTLGFECLPETSNDSDVAQSAWNLLHPKFCQERPVSTSTNSETLALLSMKARTVGLIASCKTGGGIQVYFVFEFSEDCPTDHIVVVAKGGRDCQ